VEEKLKITEFIESIPLSDLKGCLYKTYNMLEDICDWVDQSGYHSIFVDRIDDTNLYVSAERFETDKEYEARTGVNYRDAKRAAELKERLEETRKKYLRLKELCGDKTEK
jgi:hypothetical protein